MYPRHTVAKSETLKTRQLNFALGLEPTHEEDSLFLNPDSTKQSNDDQISLLVV